MTYFNRGGGDSRNYFYGSNARPERKEMFDAVCAKCGGVAKVPFKPNGRKDVFCSKCFGEMNGEDQRGGNRFENRRDDRGFGDRSRFEKPSYRGNESQNNVDLSEINAKLDKIIKLLSPEAPKKEMTEKVLEEIESSIGKKMATKKVKKTLKKE